MFFQDSNQLPIALLTSSTQLWPFCPLGFYYLLADDTQFCISSPDISPLSEVYVPVGPLPWDTLTWSSRSSLPNHPTHFLIQTCLQICMLPTLMTSQLLFNLTQKSQSQSSNHIDIISLTFHETIFSFLYYSPNSGPQHSFLDFHKSAISCVPVS